MGRYDKYLLVTDILQGLSFTYKCSRWQDIQHKGEF